MKKWNFVFIIIPLFILCFGIVISYAYAEESNGVAGVPWSTWCEIYGGGMLNSECSGITPSNVTTTVSITISAINLIGLGAAGIGPFESILAVSNIVKKIESVIGVRLISPLPTPDGPGPHRITIYVDNSDIVGHTWISLTNEKGKRIDRGVYDARQGQPDGSDIKAILGIANAQVREDGGHGWSVRQTIEVTKDQYQRALDRIKQWENKTEKAETRYMATGWWGENCNTFAEDVLNEAGLELPRTKISLNIPSSVADKLKKSAFSERHSETYGTDFTHKRNHN